MKKNILDGNPGRSVNLMNELASVTALQATASVTVQLVDINVASVSFIAPEKLLCAATDLLSMRFTLPGRSRLHFAMISLLPTVVHEASGYRYDARFVRTDPQTVDHIIQCCSPISSEGSKDSGSLHLH